MKQMSMESLTVCNNRINAIILIVMYSFERTEMDIYLHEYCYSAVTGPKYTAKPLKLWMVVAELMECRI